MQIIQQLRAGTVHFQTDANNNENFVTRPPTSLNLQAARAIEELVQVCQGLERANQTLVQQITQTENELNAQRGLLQKLLADAELTRTGTVDTNTKAAAPERASGVEAEAGPTHAAT